MTMHMYEDKMIVWNQLPTIGTYVQMGGPYKTGDFPSYLQ